MIWGLQWDATCIWLKNSGFDLDAPKSWGNTGTNIYATGSNESWKSNNIYDFAGNCIEFTQEKQNPFLRQGRSSRYSHDDCTPTMSSNTWGSRAVLYIKPELD